MVFHSGRGIYLCLLCDDLSQHRSGTVTHTVRGDNLPYPSRKLYLACDIHIQLYGLQNTCTSQKNERIYNGKYFSTNWYYSFI